MNTTNLITVSDEEPAFMYFNKDAYIISISVFTAVSGIVNLFLTVVILLSSTLRCSSKHLLILAICICSLYNAAFADPLIIQQVKLRKFIHGCELNIVLAWKSPYITLSILSLLVVSLGADFLVRLLTRKKVVSIILAIIMIIASVVVSVAVLLPLLLTGEPFSFPGGCTIMLAEEYLTAVNVLSFLPQAVLMLVATFLVSCLSRVSTNTAVAKPFPLDIVLACAVMILLELPFALVLITFSSCSGSVCTLMYLVRQSLMLLVYIRPCVMSFVWFLCPVTRNAIRQVWCCCPNPIEDSERSGQSLDHKVKMTDLKGIDNEALRL